VSHYIIVLIVETTTAEWYKEYT